MVEAVATVGIEGEFFAHVGPFEKLNWIHVNIIKIFFRQFEIWHQLGTVEIEDQIAVTDYLIKNLPIIDPKRVL